MNAEPHKHEIKIANTTGLFGEFKCYHITYGDTTKHVMKSLPFLSYRLKWEIRRAIKNMIGVPVERGAETIGPVKHLHRQVRNYMSQDGNNCTSTNGAIHYWEITIRCAINATKKLSERAGDLCSFWLLVPLLQCWPWFS